MHVCLAVMRVDAAFLLKPLHRTTALLCASALAIVATTVVVTPAPAHAATCSGTVPSDINGDGQGDLAIGETGNHSRTGAVHVLYGTPTGLVTDRSGTALNDQYFTQDTPGVPGTGKRFEWFGDTVLLADVNGDHCADLIAWAMDQTNARDGSQPSLASTTTVLYGSPTGITTAGAQIISSGTFSSPMHWVEPATVADVNQDGIGDLVTTASSTTNGGPRVGVVYGSRAGLNRGAQKAEVLNNAALGLSADLESKTGDIVAGDFDGDGKTELAVGQTSQYQEGYAAIVRRTPTGWVRGAQLKITSPGVPKAPEEYSDFGSTLAVGDFDADGYDDLAAGVSLEVCDSACKADPDAERDPR